ncbi:MAG: antitoxin Xre/MbcA/ParS toxin-binding domain-containing protein [Sporichthyaceae bacterium]
MASNTRTSPASAAGRSTAKKAAAPGRVAKGRARAVAPPTLKVAPAAAAHYSPDAPVARVVQALGNNVVAELLGVSRSQPSRWRSGKERLSPENRRRISDLDHVLDRLLAELHPEEAGLWLCGNNAHLGGARPIDVLTLRGAGPVLSAIDALGQGAFA